MVSKLIVAGILFGAAFADPMEIKTEDFESAICIKKYQAHTEVSKAELNLEDLIKTHGCCDKHQNLCAIKADDGEHLMCSGKTHEEFEKVKESEFKLGGDKFNIHEKTITKVEKIRCKPATHKYDHKFEKALRVMTDMKSKLEDLGEVKEDTSTICFAVTEEEPKKDADKKEGDKEKKEEKKSFKIHYFTVKEKNHKTTDKVEKVTIFENKYEALFCGTKAEVEKETKAFLKAEEASGCCSCAWYVWVIVAVVIVGAGVGAYFVLKEDDKEDEYEAEYGTA